MDSVQERAGVFCSEIRCHPWERHKAKEVTEQLVFPAALQTKWKREPAHLQSPSHNKIILIAGIDFYFSSAKWVISKFVMKGHKPYAHH